MITGTITIEPVTTVSTTIVLLLKLTVSPEQEEEGGLGN